MIDTTSNARAGYGLGISSYRNGQQTVYGHNGRTIGFAGSLRDDPATGVTVVVHAQTELHPQPNSPHN